MLNSKDLIKKMVLHFPRWMDIRKRTAKSNGGNLLLSISEEFDEIQKAINDYKRDFFIDNYENREDDIVAFLYKAQTGIIDPLFFAMIFPKLTLTLDIKTFYEKDKYVYYEDGYLFFKTDDIETNFDLTIGPAKIEYSFNDYKMTSVAEKIHVWNVFDEFAVFVGLERHEGEKNSDLVKRIYGSRQALPNSSEPGLKNAILNELRIIDSSLTSDEIKIERPTPENLRKYYKEFGSVIEKLAQFNKDIYRTKQWDISAWNQDFNHVDYIPHAWDAIVDSYQNGVGFTDDLKVSLINADDTADATVTFYQKSDIAVKEYIRDNDIKSEVTYSLQKYSNALKPVEVNYKISASEAMEFTSEDIGIESLVGVNSLEFRKIEDLVDVNFNSNQTIEIQDTKRLEDDKYYQVIFEPSQDYGYMKISSCKVTNELGIETNIALPTNGYTATANGELINNNTKKYVFKRHEFMSYSNVFNTQEGIKIEDLSSSADLSLDLVGMDSQYIKIQYDCPTVPVRPGFGLTFNNCLTNNDGSIVSDTSVSMIGKPKYIIISLKANNLKFKLSGYFMTNIKINNKLWTPSPDQTVFNLGNWSLPELANEKGKPLNFEIRIDSTNDYASMVLSDLFYSNYEVTCTLEHGTIANTAFGEVLPRTTDNKNILNIKMRSYIGYSPVLNFIHIGSPLTGAKYYSKIISPSLGSGRTISVDTNCKMSLCETDSLGNVLQVIQRDYKPYYIYKAVTDNARLKINLSEYSTVNSVQLPQGTLETIGTGINAETYIKLKQNEVIQFMSVNGNRIISTGIVKLNDILKINSSFGDKIYANTLVKGLVAVRNNKEELIKITQSIIGGISSDAFRFVNVPSYLGCAFVVNEENNKIIVNDLCSEPFESVYLFPKDTTMYVAFNKTRILRQEEQGIEIVNLFSPFLPENKLMVYTVEAMDDANDVRFDHSSHDNFALLNHWSLGRKTLRIRNSVGISDMLDLESVRIQEEFDLKNILPLTKLVTTNNGNIVELARYIVNPPEGMEVIMESNTGVPINMEPDFYETEEIIVEDDGFNKLYFSNIDTLIYIGLTPWSEDQTKTNPISSSDYSLMKTEGILVWKDIIPGTKLYVFYSHKIPSALTFSDPELLYKLVEYNLDAYKKLGEFIITDRSDGDIVDLSSDESYLESDRIAVFCSKPGFQLQFDKGFLKFKKISKDRSIAIKTGYYYVDGDEYFYFANDASDVINKTKYVELYNVDKEFGNFMLNKKANNFIKNSHMNIGSIANTYSVNFENDKKMKGISNLNAITACDSFNHWIPFGTTISIKAGYNGLGLLFEPIVLNGYAYIDITQYLCDNTLISMYATEGIKASIGKEKKMYNLSLTDSTSITIIGELSGKKNQNIIEYSFTKDADTRYYLIVQGSGLIDDIILGDNSLLTISNLHKKNIDKLKLHVDEIVSSDYVCRLYFDSDRSGKSNGSEVKPDGTIINGSTIDWNITKLETIDSNIGWSKCVLQNADIKNGVVTTLQNEPGTLETFPIYVGDINTVKSFIFKINDVEFENMSHFTTKILVSEHHNGFYRTAKNSITDNVGYIDGTGLKLPYVKLLITIPGGNIIKNVDMFVEYMSSNNWAPSEVAVTDGTYISGILDTFYTSNYKVNSIEIDSVSNINDIQLQIRAAKEGYEGDVWSSWKTIELNDSLDIANTIIFDGYRFFQAMVSLKGRDAYVKINHIDLGVI